MSTGNGAKKIKLSRENKLALIFVIGVCVGIVVSYMVFLALISDLKDSIMTLREELRDIKYNVNFIAEEVDNVDEINADIETIVYVNNELKNMLMHISQQLQNMTKNEEKYTAVALHVDYVYVVYDNKTSQVWLWMKLTNLSPLHEVRIESVMVMGKSKAVLHPAVLTNDTIYHVNVITIRPCEEIELKPLYNELWDIIKQPSYSFSANDVDVEANTTVRLLFTVKVNEHTTLMIIHAKVISVKDYMKLYKQMHSE